MLTKEENKVLRMGGKVRVEARNRNGAGTATLSLTASGWFLDIHCKMEPYYSP